MTREEHISNLETIGCDGWTVTTEAYKSLQFAIEVLEQEPSKREIEREYLFQSLCEDFKKLQAENDDLRKRLEQKPKTIQEIQAESEKYQKAFEDGYEQGYAQARFDYEQEPCEDAINRQAVLDCLTATGLKKYDFILNARDKIKNLQSVKPQEPKWIPVSERLPQELVHVLCCDRDGYMTIGFVSEKAKDWCFVDAEIDIDVVAWMPLPQSYEPKGVIK